MQATFTHKKNQEASMRNLETQVGQLAKQIANQQGGQFTANTQTNLKEQCKAITIRCGKKIGHDVNEEITKSIDKNRRKTIEAENVAETSEDKSEERVGPETVIGEENSDSESKKTEEEPMDSSGKKQVGEGQNWRKIKEGVPLRNVPYPHAPSRREAGRQFNRSTEILKNLHINICFTETLQ